MVLDSDIKPDDLPQVDGVCCGHAYLKLSDTKGCLCLCAQCQALNCDENDDHESDIVTNGQPPTMVSASTSTRDKVKKFSTFSAAKTQKGGFQ